MELHIMAIAPRLISLARFFSTREPWEKLAELDSAIGHAAEAVVETKSWRKERSAPYKDQHLTDWHKAHDAKIDELAEYFLASGTTSERDLKNLQNELDELRDLLETETPNLLVHFPSVNIPDAYSPRERAESMTKLLAQLLQDEKESVIQEPNNYSQTDNEDGRPEWDGPLEKLAIGRDEKGWHRFVETNGRWQDYNIVAVSKGLQDRLMLGFAEGNGILGKIAATRRELDLRNGPKQEATAVWGKVVPEISKLRSKLIKAFGLPLSSEPFSWDEGSQSYQAAIKIGYAVVDPGDHASGEPRLRFKLQNEL